MDHRDQRNEFGLDELNAVDVQKERARSGMPWVFGVVVLLAVAALMIFGLPSTTDQHASRVPSPTTTGSAIPPPQQ
jgi:hypothetical protein